jgi:propanediol utilization protein
MTASRRSHAATDDSMRIRVPVVISAPHVHLTAELIEELFCDRYHLHVRSPLAQPQQFAAEESVSLIGPRGRISNVRIIGPPRFENQIELPHSAALALGIDAPVRESGMLAGTPGITIEGPRTRATLENGVIRALRHIHMSPEIAEPLALKDHDRIDVVGEGDWQAPLFENVVVRVAPGFQLELHVDADEGAAKGLRAGDLVFLGRVGRRATP